MPRYIIGLGSSDPLAYTYIQRAIVLMAQSPHFTLQSTSCMHVTPPAHGQTLFRFVNAAACLETPLAPQAFWWQLRTIEHQLGRMRIHRFGPRTLDLDILWRMEGPYQSAHTTIPHPQFFKRSFAYLPAIEALKKTRWPMPMAFKTLGHTPSSQ